LLGQARADVITQFSQQSAFPPEIKGLETWDVIQLKRVIFRNTRMSIERVRRPRRKALAGLALLALLVVFPDAGFAEDFQQSAFACTRLSRSFWLPLSTLVERLRDSGHVVAFALTTPDDCYELMVRGREGILRTIIYHPVSGKPLG
jgi:Peptidase propeptide and YPEB domain